MYIVLEHSLLFIVLKLYGSYEAHPISKSIGILSYILDQD